MQHFVSVYSILSIIGFVMALFHPKVLIFLNEVRKIALKSVLNLIFTFIILWCFLPLAIPHMVIYWLDNLIDKYGKNDNE